MLLSIWKINFKTNTRAIQKLGDIMTKDVIYRLKNKKIVHISPTYFEEEIGGGERYPWELVNALSKYIPITFITFGNKKATIQFSNNLTIKKYPAYTSFVFSKHNPLSLSFLRELKNADLIHVHQFNTVVSNIAILYASYKKIPVVVTDYGGGIAPSRIINIGNLVDVYLLISKYSTRKFRKYRKRYRVIFGGVNISKFKPFNSYNKEDKILFVGRILPHKGIDYLIRAIQQINVKLHIVGKPFNVKYLKYLESLDESNRVIFKFGIPDNELIREYNSSLVTVLPSVYVDCYGTKYSEPELLGLTLLESMACGTPVICTNVGGMPEIVDENKTGFIVPPNDSKSLESKLRYLLSNPDIERKMGRIARKVVLKRYTWDNVAIRVLSEYQKLLDND